MNTKTSKTAPKQEDLNVCACGCTEATKSNYRPGHDARHAGVVGRALAANPKDRAALADLKQMSPALAAKVVRVRANTIAKAAKAKAED